MKYELQKKAQESESAQRKALVAFTAFLSLAYTAILAYFFYSHWSKAEELGGEFRCSVAGKKSDGSGAWVSWMHLAWVNYLILTVAGAVALVSGFVVVLRGIAACTLCLAGIFNLVVMIGVTAARYNSKGKACADFAGDLNNLTPGDDDV